MRNVGHTETACTHNYNVPMLIENDLAKWLKNLIQDGVIVWIIVGIGSGGAAAAVAPADYDDNDVVISGGGAGAAAADYDNDVVGTGVFIIKI